MSSASPDCCSASNDFEENLVEMYGKCVPKLDTLLVVEFLDLNYLNLPCNNRGQSPFRDFPSHVHQQYNFSSHSYLHLIHIHHHNSTQLDSTNTTQLHHHNSSQLDSTNTTKLHHHNSTQLNSTNPSVPYNHNWTQLNSTNTTVHD